MEKKPFFRPEKLLLHLLLFLNFQEFSLLFSHFHLMISHVSLMSENFDIQKNVLTWKKVI